MRAVVQRAYGAPEEVLEAREVPTPVAKEDEVLVRVRAASVHPDVWHVVRGVPYVLRLMGAGLRRPHNPIPGTDVAGVVAAVGKGARRFRPGDEVFGETTREHQWTHGGAFADHVAVPEEVLAPKPPRLSFTQAAAVPTSGLIALRCLRDEGRVQAGQRVLVNGAAGGVGHLAVQLAKAHGAEVTAVDRAGKLDLLRAIGADRVLDAADDFTRRGERWDLVLDVPGNHPFSAVRRALTPTGLYVLVGHDAFGAAGGRWVGSMGKFLGLLARSRFTDHLPKPDFDLPPKGPPMAALARFAEEGNLTPLVERTYGLDEVPAALRHLERGVRGKLVIEV